MKKLAFILALPWLLGGCGTIATYKPQLPAGSPRPADYVIPVYDQNMEIPRPCKVIGEISVGHTSFTVMGGSADEEMEKVMKAAHEKGADAVQVVSVDKPGYTTTAYAIKANLLRYADDWERYPMSENDFVAYLRQNSQTLDPIEGIWSGGWPNRIGIIRDATKPGRDFIAFTLQTDATSWQPGYKRMDIARGNQPGVYQLRYYHDDFSKSEVIVTLDQNRSFEFMVNSEDSASLANFTKLELPLPAH